MVEIIEIRHEHQSKILSRPVAIHDASVLGQAVMEAGVDAFDRDFFGRVDSSISHIQ